MDQIIDMNGLAVSTVSHEAVQAADQFVEEVLVYGNRWHCILAAVEADPNWSLGYILCADYHMSMRESQVDAKECLKMARDLMGSATPREAQYLLAYEALVVEGDLRKAAGLFSAVLEAHPRDLFALKRGQLLWFFLGQPEEMLRVAQGPVAEANRGRPFFDGMVAFALEQAGQLSEAEATAWRGLESSKEAQVPDPWTHHALAHALYFQGRLTEGISLMQGLAGSWGRCCSFMLTHNWWHIALFHLDRGTPQDWVRLGVLFDTRIWGVDKANIQDQLGALGLLIKWELRAIAPPSPNQAPETMSALGCGMGDGVRHEERWIDVLHHVARRGVSGTGADPLFDLLALYGFVSMGLGDNAEALFNRIVSNAEACPTPERRLDLTQVWVPFARGIRRFAAGDRASAVSDMRGAWRRLAVVGGSSEQRDVLIEMFLHALLAAGCWDEACRLLEQRQRERHHAVPETARLLAWAYRKRGDTASVGQARRELLDLSERYALEAEREAEERRRQEERGPRGQPALQMAWEAAAAQVAKAAPAAASTAQAAVSAARAAIAEPLEPQFLVAWVAAAAVAASAAVVVLRSSLLP
uniref:Tetratricopeptide repeat protein 38 n=1 Tax=Rhizochromulina marina TaxID=1034831 RepID=A0A7S2RM94_9STRA|mmetsp:Transcript_18307/g.53502  ORF Transcript_18307/g.53502 Transcript_18307/m.53502 type:complete len:585 (+) Transcript_18307:97-1851(+)